MASKPTRPQLLRSAVKCTRRWMFYRDMPMVLDIDRAMNLPTAHVITKQQLLETCRFQNVVPNIWELAAPPHTLVAYCIHRLHRNRLEILRMGVDQQFQRMGIGREIVEHLKTTAAVHQKFLTADVSEYNLGAQLFFHAMGFRVQCIAPDYIAEGHAAYEFNYRHVG